MLEASRDWRTRERKRKTWSLVDSVTRLEEPDPNQLETNLRRYSYEPRKIGWHKEMKEEPVFVV